MASPAHALPTDVWGQIFAYLPFASVAAVARVCQRFRKLVESDVFRTQRLRDGLRSVSLPNPPAKADLRRRGDDNWAPPQPGTVDQFLRACVHKPELGAQEILARAWTFLIDVPLGTYMLYQYANAASPEDRELVMVLTCRIGLGNPQDLFRSNHALMHMLLSVGARQLPLAAKLLEMSTNVKRLLRLGASFPPPPPPPSSPASPAPFVALLLSKTSAKVIAEQLTLRNWSAYSALAPSHLQTWRSRAVNNILNFIAQEIGTLNLICSYALLTQKSAKERTTVLDRLGDVLKELRALRNFHMAMGLTQTLSNRWFCGARVVPAHSYRFRDLLAEASDLFRADRNFKNYRRELAAAAPLPHMPSLTVPRIDLRFVTETHHVTIGELHNWKRLDVLAMVIRQALAGQAVPYALTPDPAIQQTLQMAFACTEIRNEHLDQLYDLIQKK